MALTTIQYQPAITGAAIRAQIQAIQMPMTSSAQTQALAIAIWRSVLQTIYGDFNSVLAASITTFISTGQSQFMPAPPNPLIPPPLILATLIPKAASTAQIIVSEISALGNLPAQQMATEIWTKVFKNIFLDMKTVFSTQIAIQCNTTTTTVGIGAIAPPHIGTRVPVPATLTNPFVSSVLQGFMEAYYNENTARTIAAYIVSRAQSLSPNAAAESVADTIWDAVILKLKEGITTQFGNHIKMFLQQPHWSIPIGTPGNVSYPPYIMATTPPPVFGVII